MIILEINNTSIKIPSTIDEVSLSMGVELIHFVTSKTPSYNEKISILSTLSNLDISILLRISEKDINKIYDNIQFLKLEDAPVTIYKSFYLDKTLYGMLDLKKMTVNDYANIDFYLSESEYPLEHLDKIISVLYRKITHKKQSVRNILINKANKLFFKNLIPAFFKEYEIEEYKEDSLDYKIFAKKLSLGFAIGVYHMLMEEREKIINEFPLIFKNMEIPEEDKDQYDDIDITPINKSFEQTWGMLHIISTLSSDLFERTEWLKRPIRELFTYFSYYNAKILRDNEIIRQQNKMQ